MSRQIKLKIETVPIRDLVPDPQNAKLHSEEQIEQIMGSIQAFGFNDPIAVDAELMIIEGHGRLQAAKRLKMEEIPVIRIGHLSPAERRAYMLAHNKLTMNTGFDPETLIANFNLLEEADISIDLTGFDMKEVNYLLGRDGRSGGQGREVDVQSHTREINIGEDEFEHRCPRCGFEFNDSSKGEG